MFYLDCIIAILLVVSFIAHFFFGTNESKKTRPQQQDEAIQHCWLQLFNCWHMVSVDLLVYSVGAIGILFYPDTLLWLKAYLGLIFSLYTLSWTLTLWKNQKLPYLKKEQPHPFLFMVLAGLSCSSFYLGWHS